LLPLSRLSRTIRRFERLAFEPSNNSGIPEDQHQIVELLMPGR
jgi:hypothetical protein